MLSRNGVSRIRNSGFLMHLHINCACLTCGPKRCMRRSCVIKYRFPNGLDRP